MRRLKLLVMPQYVLRLLTWDCNKYIKYGSLLLTRGFLFFLGLVAGALRALIFFCTHPGRRAGALTAGAVRLIRLAIFCVLFLSVNSDSSLHQVVFWVLHAQGFFVFYP